MVTGGYGCSSPPFYWNMLKVAGGCCLFITSCHGWHDPSVAGWDSYAPRRRLALTTHRFAVFFLDRSYTFRKHEQTQTQISWKLGFFPMFHGSLCCLGWCWTCPDLPCFLCAQMWNGSSKSFAQKSLPSYEEWGSWCRCRCFKSKLLKVFIPNLPWVPSVKDVDFIWFHTIFVYESIDNWYLNIFNSICLIIICSWQVVCLHLPLREKNRVIITSHSFVGSQSWWRHPTALWRRRSFVTTTSRCLLASRSLGWLYQQ